MELKEQGRLAAMAAYKMALLSTEEKNKVLVHAAKALLQHSEEIIQENEKDIARAKENGMHPGMVDRLLLNQARIEAMAEGLREVAELPDPVGHILEEWERPNGLKISKISVPMGVVGIIYESRPNVTADAFGLCFKSGNCVILKGGSDAIASNVAIVNILRESLEACQIDPNVLQIIASTDRTVTSEFMKMKEYVDVLIPRGGAGLIRAVVENSTIPVIETGTGNCHIYVDEFADLEQAIPIIFNSKTQKIGACNSAESLVVHSAIAKEFLPKLQEALKERVELRGDERCLEILPDVIPAVEADFGTEYLDYIMSMKMVDSMEEAILHINRYHTKHSDAILTTNEERAARFVAEVDSACVYVNASTRFTDGFEFGFGAEIGISTQKLHARGPMGLPELTTYKYKILGNGQIRQ